MSVAIFELSGYDFSYVVGGQEVSVRDFLVNASDADVLSQPDFPVVLKPFEVVFIDGFLLFLCLCDFLMFHM